GPKVVKLKAEFLAVPPAAPELTGLDVTFRPDPTVWDGRFANNSSLQELPKPFTKLTWDNAIFMSPALGKRLGVGSSNDETTDVVELTYEGGKVQGLGLIVRGHPEDSVTAHF